MVNKEIIKVSEVETLISERKKELEDTFLEIQQPRSSYAIEHFVVGQHDTEPMQYYQCVLEMQIKYDTIRRALLGRKKIEIEIEELEKDSSPASIIDVELKKIDIEETDRAILGAIREFDILYRLWQGFSKKYSHEEIMRDQEEYWRRRLRRQAEQDIQASGRIGVGNQDALRMAGMVLTPSLIGDHIQEIESRYLSVGDRKVLIVVPTREKAVSGLPCVDNLVIPSGVQVKYLNVYGKSVDDAYTIAVNTCLEDGADFLFTVEDDTFPPKDALVRLLDTVKKSEEVKIIGAWYPKKSSVREGTPIIIGKDGYRQALSDDGDIHEVYTLPMGCTLFSSEVFRTILPPWFVTTSHLTQDSFFSQKAREAGYRLFCDTSIRCVHTDFSTGISYK